MDIQERVNIVDARLKGNILRIPSGYSRTKHAEVKEYRNPVDVAEMIEHCSRHSHIWFLSTQGTARECKVNGKVRTWKRDAQRIEVPVKYGLYEYAIFTAADISRILIPV